MFTKKFIAQLTCTIYKDKTKISFVFVGFFKQKINSIHDILPILRYMFTNRY